jgi:hypothetical protein
MKHKHRLEITSRLAQLDSVSVGDAQHGRWLLLMGELIGWCGQGVHGMCVAFAIDAAPYDEGWLLHAALWLASLRSQPDDALCIESDQLYLVRRYDHDIGTAELRAGIEQQAAIARWLSAHHAAARATYVDGRRR